MRISLTFLEVLDPNASTLITGSKNIQHDGVMNNLTRDKEIVQSHTTADVFILLHTKSSRLAGTEQVHILRAADMDILHFKNKSVQFTVKKLVTTF